MVTSGSFIGIGLYTYVEAARLIRIPTAKLRRWVNGYTVPVRGELRHHASVIQHSASELYEFGMVTFVEMIELLLIHRFRSSGVSLQNIRRASDELAIILNTDHPFAVRTLHSDGKHIIARLVERTQEDTSKGYFSDLSRMQGVLDIAEEYFIPHLDYDITELAQRFYPMGVDRSVVVDPRRAYGQPIVARSGIPTYPLYQMHLVGQPVTSIAKWYHTDREDVRAAIRFEEAMEAAA